MFGVVKTILAVVGAMVLIPLVVLVFGPFIIPLVIWGAFIGIPIFVGIAIGRHMKNKDEKKKEE